MYGLTYSTTRDGLSFEIATFACRWKAEEAAAQYARDFAARYPNHNARTYDISDTVDGQRQGGTGVVFECNGGCDCARPGLQVRFVAFECLVDPEPGDTLPPFHDNRHVYEPEIECE